MGYTHYWKKFSETDADTFNEWAALTLKAATLSGIPFKVEMGENDLMLNGIEDDSAEDFYMETGVMKFEFCKTYRRPYDVIVVASLVIAAHLFGPDFVVSSDGEEEDWKAGMDLAALVLGEDVAFPCEEG